MTWRSGSTSKGERDDAALGIQLEGGRGDDAALGIQLEGGRGG